MSYNLKFSDEALAKLEALGRSDAKKLRQVFLKCAALRRNPRPQDCNDLRNFNYKGLKGWRVDQGEYRIVFAVDEEHKDVLIGYILDRNEDYKELKNIR